MNSWVRNKSDEAAVDQGCTFDLKAADRVRFFFERFLRHSKGPWAGKPFELLPWQWDRVVAPAFGWKMADGTRRFRRVGVGIPKKNGKSTLLAGLALYMLVGDGEAGAECYTAAADRSQASIIFNEAAQMVEASDALARRLHVRRAGKQIATDNASAWLQALSADVPTKEGLNIHFLAFDELHAQTKWDLWNTLKYGGASRTQPMQFWISTAGIHDPTALWFDQWKQARAIQAGETVDISYLGVIYEADSSDDPYAETTWIRANPSYGVTIHAREMQEAAQEARTSPIHENVFKRYRLNIATAQETKWISAESWNACRFSFTEKDMAGQRCWIGLDLAATIDVAAAAALFKVGDKYRVLPYFWIPRDMAKRRKREGRTPLDYWAECGYVRLTDRPDVDYGVIRDDLNALDKVFKIDGIIIDSWNATSIAAELESDGFKVEQMRFGYRSIGAATKELEKRVVSGGLEHPGNPVLDWMVGNVMVTQDSGGNIKPDKDKSKEKIDGVVAILLALARAIQKVTKISKYETQGLTTW